ncbi:hypothetical protein AWENTII_005865 [Aspergillus wentii]
MKHCLSSIGTDEDYSLFCEYYSISPDAVRQLVEYSTGYGPYDNALEVLNLGADLYHLGHGAPPGVLDYGFQGVLECVKKCLARIKFEMGGDEEEEEEEENEDRDLLKEMDDACGEFWYAWNV